MNTQVIPIFGETAVIYYGYITVDGEEREGVAEVRYLTSNMLEIRKSLIWQLRDAHNFATLLYLEIKRGDV